MPEGSPAKEKGRHSDPSTTSLTPLQEKSNRLSTGSRTRSLSPRKRAAKQPLHIRMNLTEMQMDRITDAVTHKVNGSPAKIDKRVEVTPSKSQLRHDPSSQSPAKTPFNAGTREEYRHLLSSPTFSELMPDYEANLLSSGLASRRCRDPPPPIMVGSGRNAPSMPHRSEMEAVSALNSPLNSKPTVSPQTGIGRESFYSQDSRRVHEPSPLNLRADIYHHPTSHINNAVLDAYGHWEQVQVQSPGLPPESPTHPQSFAQRLRRSKSIGDGPQRQAGHAASTLPSPSRPTFPERSNTRAKESPPFSPLALYFRSHDFPIVKKGEKTMIGHNGWLERTENTLNKEKKIASKKTGILDSIKKIAKDMTELHYPNRRSNPTSKEVFGPQLTVSLNAREQSLLYCELEFHLTNAVNDYITAELDRGHLDPDKLKKIADAWQHHGRPRVVGFRYDLETQLELIGLHIDDFVFYGRRQGNPMEIGGLLHSMKINSRAMRIRTFCQPDSVIAKQLVDSQSLFNMISVPQAQQIALAETAQFFKVIVEREIDVRGKQSRETRRPKDPHGQRNEARTPQASFGGERRGYGSARQGYDSGDDIFV